MKPLTPASPHAIIMVGIPGSGKSMFAEHFADTFQAPIFNRSKLQRDLQLEDAQVDALEDTILNEYLKTHRTILLEGNFNRKSQRVALTHKLAKAGYRPLLVWVQTDVVESRYRATKAYPQGSGLTPDKFDSIVKQFQAPTIQEHAIVISGKHTYATQLKIVLKQLASDVQRPPRPPEASSRGRSIVLR